MNNRKDTTRRDDITNVRALAIFLVVLGHSIILYSSAWGYYPTEQKSILLDNLKFLINGIQMPLFFSLSGFCFGSVRPGLTYMCPHGAISLTP